MSKLFGRVRKALQFDEGLTARGTEKKRSKYGREPDLHADTHPEVSPQAVQVIKYRATGRQAHLDNLIGRLTSAIKDDKQFKIWRVEEKAPIVARIAIEEIFCEPLTNQAAAEMLGVNVKTYVSKWRDKIISEAKKWPTFWLLEAMREEGKR